MKTARVSGVMATVDGFYIALVETNEEPIPLRGPFSSYDAAIEWNYQAARA